MEGNGHAEVAVRETPDPRRAEDWALVLASLSIPCRVEHGYAGSSVVVGGELASRASDALAAYDREQASRAEELEKAPPPPPAWGPTWTGAVVAWALLAFYGVTGPIGRADPWFAMGGADAALIASGELWRATTALTLHADLAHVVGNAGASVVFVTAVAWRMGPGVTILLLVVAGTLGNLGTAFVYQARHLSIGASTATFAALGLLTAIQVVDRGRHPLWRRLTVVFGASLALLGLLGTGEESDLLAHLFGWLAGGMVGLATVPWWRVPPAGGRQALWAVMAVVMVAVAWTVAAAAV